MLSSLVSSKLARPCDYVVLSASWTSVPYLLTFDNFITRWIVVIELWSVNRPRAPPKILTGNPGISTSFQPLYVAEKVVEPNPKILVSCAQVCASDITHCFFLIRLMMLNFSWIPYKNCIPTDSTWKLCMTNTLHYTITSICKNLKLGGINIDMLFLY